MTVPKPDDNLNNEKKGEYYVEAAGYHKQIDFIDNSINANKYALISSICSVMGFFAFWWLSFIGIIFGIIALKKIKISKEAGKGLAIAGIIIGIVDLALVIIGIILKS